MAGLLPELAFFICLLAVCCSALSVDKFISFGTANGDTIFFSNDDDTTSIAVPLRFPFYDRLFTTIHVRLYNSLWHAVFIYFYISQSMCSFALDQQQWTTLL